MLPLQRPYRGMYLLVFLQEKPMTDRGWARYTKEKASCPWKLALESGGWKSRETPDFHLLVLYQTFTKQSSWRGKTIYRTPISLWTDRWCETWIIDMNMNIVDAPNLNPCKPALTHSPAQQWQRILHQERTSLNWPERPSCKQAVARLQIYTTANNYRTNWWRRCSRCVFVGFRLWLYMSLCFLKVYLYVGSQNQPPAGAGLPWD